MVVSTFTPVSLEPPLVSICVQRTSETWPVLAGSRQHIGVSILSTEQEREGRLLSIKHGDRFERIAWTATDEGAVLIDGAVEWLQCSVTESVVAGDHLIVLLGIEKVFIHVEMEPLVFHGSRFRRLEF